MINRKAVITERKITGLFHKLGLFFAASEAQEMVKYFRTVQVMLANCLNAVLILDINAFVVGKLLAQPESNRRSAKSVHVAAHG